MSASNSKRSESYVAEDLPSELRAGIDANHRVSVEVRDNQSEQPRYLKFSGIAAYMNTSVEEAVARVREWRDDWD